MGNQQEVSLSKSKGDTNFSLFSFKVVKLAFLLLHLLACQGQGILLINMANR